MSKKIQNGLAFFQNGLAFFLFFQNGLAFFSFLQNGHFFQIGICLVGLAANVLSISVLSSRQMNSIFYRLLVWEHLHDNLSDCVTAPSDFASDISHFFKESLKPGTDVMIFKISSSKKWRNYWRFVSKQS
jgi:hypothetical protein